MPSATIDSTPAPIVVVGGGYSGLRVFHSLLKSHLIPSQQTGAAVPKIILISASKDSYWNPAAPRAIVTHETVENDKIFKPIVDGMKQYESTGLATFIHGRVDKINLEANTVQYTLMDDEDEIISEGNTISYGQVVVALGSAQAMGTPFQRLPGQGSKVLKGLLQKWRKQIEFAESIVIAGGGPTGTETASEIIMKYPKKKVTLVTADASLLRLREDVDATAKSLLESKGVKVILNTKITDTKVQKNGKIVVTLSTPTGTETLETDSYIPAMGARPNNSSLPSSVLNPQGWITVDGYLRLRDSTDSKLIYPNAWGIGDALHFPIKSIAKTMDMVPVIVNNVAYTLDLPSLRPDGCSFTGRSAPKLKEHVYTDKPLQIVPLVGSGTGILMGWRPWGWFVNMVKSTYLVAKHTDLVLGKGDNISK